MTKVSTYVIEVDALAQAIATYRDRSDAALADIHENITKELDKLVKIRDKYIVMEALLRMGSDTGLDVSDLCNITELDSRIATAEGILANLEVHIN